MPISVVCAGCGSKLNAPDSSAGKTLSCPKCKARGTIPASREDKIPLPTPAPQAVSTATPTTKPARPADSGTFTKKPIRTLRYVESNLLPGEQIVYSGDL